MQKPEVNIITDRAKIVSLLAPLQKQKLTLEQSYELERLLTKERNIAIQSEVTALDIIVGYYCLIGLDGYVEGCYYPRE
jgi:hypothetical protein